MKCASLAAGLLVGVVALGLPGGAVAQAPAQEALQETGQPQAPLSDTVARSFRQH